MTVDLKHDAIADVTIPPMSGQFGYAGYNNYSANTSVNAGSDFQQSVQMGPQAILEANGLGVKQQAPEAPQENGIETGYGGLHYQVQNVGISLQPSSILGEIGGAIGGLTKDVQQAISPPEIQAQLNPELEAGTLDGPPTPTTPVHIPSPGMRTV
jgi:hypothetical protein